jgi:hypothetical protein
MYSSMGYRSKYLAPLLKIVALALAVLPLIPVGAAHAQSDRENVALTSVRFVHAVPDAPSVDILIDGQPVFQGLAFGNVTEYVTVSPGEHQIRAVATGAGGGADLVETRQSLDEGSSYIISLLGQSGEARAKVNEVKLRALDPGKARVRVIDASVDAGKSKVAIAGGETLFEDVSFGDDTEYKEIDAGRYYLEYRVGDDATPAATFVLDAASGRVYDLIAVGGVGNGTLHILPLVTDVSPPCSETLGIGMSSDACVRVVHAQPDLGVAQAVVAGTVIAEGLQFGQASDYIPVPPGQDLDIGVVEAGQGDGANGGVEKFTLEAGQAYEIVAWSDGNEPTSASGVNVRITLAQVDLTPLPENQGRVRLIHAMADVDKADLAIPGGPNDQKLFHGVDTGDATSYEVLDAGSYPIELRYEGERGSFFKAQFEIQTGIVYDIVAVGRVEDDTVVLLMLTAPAEIRTDRATPTAAAPGITPIGSPASLSGSG